MMRCTADTSHAGRYGRANRGVSHLVIECGVATDGAMRSSCTERCVLDEEVSLIALSDGVGGGVAAQAVADAACTGVEEAFLASADEVGRLALVFECACSYARTAVAERCGACGATLLVADMEGDSLRLAWAGDTICYRLRDSRLELLTPPDRDGTSGTLLTNAVGTEHVYYHTMVTDLYPADTILMCTESVWNTLAGARILGLLESDVDACRIAKRIVAEAAANGNSEASCVVVQVLDARRARDQV